MDYQDFSHLPVAWVSLGCLLRIHLFERLSESLIYADDTDCADFKRLPQHSRIYRWAQIHKTQENSLLSPISIIREIR